MAIHGNASRSSMHTLPILFIVSVLIRNSALNPTTANTAATIFSILLHIKYVHYIVNQNRFLRWYRYDELCFDIPQEEEEAAQGDTTPHVKMFVSTVGRTKIAMITQVLRNASYAPYTVTLALPNLQHTMMGSYVYPRDFENTTSIPKKCFYS